MEMPSVFLSPSLLSPSLQALTALLSDDSKFGFIVIDGSGALFGTLQGNTREVLHKFTVDLPKKHGTLRSSLTHTHTRRDKNKNIRDVIPHQYPLVNTISLSLSGRGGQSALRFARLRMEKRHNYVRKVAETAVQLYVANDKVNVAGMVLAGSADFKTELSQSDMFDPVSVCLRLSMVYAAPIFTVISQSSVRLMLLVQFLSWICSSLVTVHSTAH